MTKFLVISGYLLRTFLIKLPRSPAQDNLKFDDIQIVLSLYSSELLWYSVPPWLHTFVPGKRESCGFIVLTFIWEKHYPGHRDLACQQARSRYMGKLFVSYERNVTFHIIFITRRDLACKLVNMFSRKPG